MEIPLQMLCLFSLPNRLEFLSDYLVKTPVGLEGKRQSICKGNSIESPVMLGLHYVPGSHGSHGSKKRSSPWCF